MGWRVLFSQYSRILKRRSGSLKIREYWRGKNGLTPKIIRELTSKKSVRKTLHSEKNKSKNRAVL